VTEGWGRVLAVTRGRHKDVTVTAVLSCCRRSTCFVVVPQSQLG